MADNFDMRAHEQMWHTFNKMAMYGVVGVALLLIAMALILL